MFDALTNLLPAALRRPSLSVPILDGALKPNNLLEEAEVLAELPGLEDLTLAGDGTLYAAAGPAIVRLTPGGAFETLATFERPVTALAVLPDGSLAAAFGNSVVTDVLGGRGRTLDAADGSPLLAANALSAAPDGSLLISDGSAEQSYEAWSRDLMEKGHSGRLLRYHPADGRVETLGRGLRYAFGALADGQGRTLVSESWAHQVTALESGRTRPAVAALPGYPARMAPAAGGGFWLSLFACRTQLVEFVLREKGYRREMLRTVDPRYWVAPALTSGEDFLEPLQGGSIKQMGILKPWAPPRSYGLVVRFNAEFLPVYSLHSRAGGRHHGITAVAQRGDELLVLSKGAGRILRLSLAGIEGLVTKGAEA